MDYPKFIQYKPTGLDSFEGKSAERVAKAIETHIEKVSSENRNTEQNKLPQIIGLEGDWGSGKSNVIRILERNVKENYHVFEYDAWGHQEELQRRSFLESLTADLIKPVKGSALLTGNTEIVDNQGEIEVVTWEKALQLLLARKIEVETRHFPRMSIAVIASVLLIIFTPIASSIAESQEFLEWWKTLLVAMIPFFAVVLFWGIASVRKRKFQWVELFKYFDQEQVDTRTYETISEKEPSVTSFVNWLKNIDASIIKGLIIVFDNMDRLPSDKVKQLWSSIHTFFSEDCYRNIWVIIPFDRKHLANAFNENTGQSQELTCQFITKTFPIIYKVAEPVFTDQKAIFIKFFLEAFGNNEKEDMATVQRIFAILRKTYTPRDVISFLNEVVSIKLSRLNDIPLPPIAIYVLKRGELINSRVEDFILSKSYLNGIIRIVEDDEALQNYITALIYDIEVEFALQVPLKQYLKKTLNGEYGYDINEYSDHRYFIPLLENEIEEVDVVNLEKAIAGVSRIKKTDLIGLTNIWNNLVNLFIHQELTSLSFIDSHKALLLYSDPDHKIKIVEFLCKSFREHKEFKGDQFFKSMKALDDFIEEKKLQINILDFVVRKEVHPEIFIEYISTGGEGYAKYRISCEVQILDEYLSGLAHESLPQMDFLSFLVNEDLFGFVNLLKTIQNLITENKITIENLPNILTAYKIITKEKPFTTLFTKAQIQSFISITTDKNCELYFDLVAMGLCNTIDNPFSESLASKVSERIEFYKEYGELLKISISWGSQLLRQSLKIMTDKSLGENLNLLEIIPLFEEIIRAIEVDEITFMNEISSWEDSISSISVDNIQTIVPRYSFYSYTVLESNKLSKHINAIAIEKIERIQTDELYTNRNSSSDYWLNTVKILIQNNILKSLPNNLLELTKRLLIDIAHGQPIPIPDSNLDTIINKADRRNLLATIKTIGEDFCNRTFLITPAQFLFFSAKFDFVNKLSRREGQIVRNIFNIIISNQDCLQEILRNKEKSAKIINDSGLDAEDFKISIQQIMESNSFPELIDFAKLIGLIEASEKVGE